MSRLLLLCVVLSLASWGCASDAGAPHAPPSLAATTAATLPVATPAVPGISIDEPPAGAPLTVPFTMRGQANTFEGVLLVDVLSDTGRVLCTRHEQSTSGVETPGRWEARLAFPPPAAQSPITLRAYNFSARDGAVENVVERSAIISADHPNIVVTSPGCGEDVGTGTLTVRGMAQVFEAALSVDIRDANGIVKTQSVMAAIGGEFSPWSATFDLSGLYPGFYDLVAYAHSAMDGSVVDEFPVQISVGP